MLGDTIDATYNDATKMVAATLAAARCSTTGITGLDKIVQAYIDLLPLVSKAHQQVPYTPPAKE